MSNFSSLRRLVVSRRWPLPLVAMLLGGGAGGGLHAQVPGNFDPAFQTPVLDQGAQVMVIQPDKKTLLGGSFTTFNGAPVNPLIRLNADGTLDTTFASSAGILVPRENADVDALLVQPDGKIIASAFGTTDAQATLTRLNADGTLDPSFTTTLPNGGVVTMGLQTNGSNPGYPIIGGSFTTVNATSITALARLNPDGSIEPSFVQQPVLDNPAINLVAQVNALVIQPNDKIVLVGLISTDSGSASGLVRLNQNGSLDLSFTPVILSSGTFQSVALQPDGSVIVSGSFTSVNGVPVPNIARFSGVDGTLDQSFAQGVNFDAGFNQLVVQADGKILASNNGGGGITLVRLNADGSMDRDYTPGFLLDQSTVTALALQPAGPGVASGTLILPNPQGNQPNVSVARLLASGPVGATTLNVAVPGTAKVSLAPNGALDHDSYGDSLLNASPARATGLALVPGTTLSFRATGLVNNIDRGTGAPAAGPDGDGLPESASSQNGVSGVSAGGDSLLGVFIDDRLADSTNAGAPATLNFGDPVNGVPGGQDYKTLQPLLGQVFFIGDGKTSTGITQQVTVPAGATHLAFGTVDYGVWNDNNGGFNVTISTGAASVPLTATALKVDGSAQGSSVPKGEAITFTVTQGALSAGVFVRVQATMTPAVERSWTDLPDTTNGGAGFLKGDGSGNYTLTTTQYPVGTGIFFRAITAESGQTDSISNQVGPFNLARANAPSLFITEKGSTADDPNANVVIVGDQITYTLKVFNDSQFTANNVKVICEIPAGQQLVSIDDSYTNDSPGDYLIGVGSLNPTGNSPLLLHVVTQVNSTANLGQVFSGLGYSVSADGGAFAQGTDLVTTTVVRPLEVVVTSNSASVSPGQPLVFQITINNRTAGAIKNVALSIPIPGTVNYGGATLTNDAGATLLGPVKNGVPTYPVNPVINGTNLLAYLGSVAAGAKDHLTITVNVPYDVAPGAAITLGGPQVTTKTPVGDANSFTLPDTSVALSGTPPANPPHFTLFKFIPDGLSLFQIIAENPVAAAFLDAAFPGLETVSGLQTLGKAVNPNILDTTDDDGNYQQAVSAPGQSGGPAVTRITYALIFSNDGGFPAQNVVLTDRIPDGTAFDGNSPYAPTFNGASLAGKVTLDPDGRTLHFNLGTIKPDKFAANGTLKKPSIGLVLYTVDVLPNDQGGPSLGAAVQAQGGTLATTSLLHTTEAQPNEIDTVVTAPGAAYLESYKGTSQAMIGHEIPYDIFYENTGGTKPADFLITDPLPAGTSFVSADLLDANHNVRPPVAGKESIDKPAIGTTSGTATFHLGKLKHGAYGFVRLIVKVEASALAVPGLLITNHPTVPASVFPGNPQRARTGPQTRGTGPVLQAPTAASINADRLLIELHDPLAGLLLQPPIGRLDVGITVPMSVKEGSTYDCLVFAANTTDAVIHAEVIVPVPPGAEFVSAGDGPFKGVYLAPNTGAQPYVLFEPIVHDDADQFIEKDVAPHSAQLYRVTLRAPSGTAGRSLVTSVQTAAANYAAGANGVTVAPVYSNNVSTYVIGAAESFADAASQIVTAELETTGSSAATLGGAALQKRIAQLTPSSLAHSTGGTDMLALNNNVLVVPLGSGNALAVGPVANLSAPGIGSSIISQDGGSIVAQGGGNLITVQNFVDQNGNGIVAQGGGNLQSLLSGIVAQGGGNIVAQGGGNLLNLGGGNLFASIGNNVISNDGGSLMPLNPAGIVAQGGGNIVAAGGGNIVAQGGGNIVAQGGGNIVAQGGGNIVAQGGGNIVAAGGGNLVSNSSGTLLSTDTSGAINLSGAGIVAAGGGNIVAQGGGNIVAQGGGN